ncbi:MAG: TolC family protein [Armatimonadetes bacterium]|nr:TolC family protein [Armatimonadota bacterium]
MTRTSLLVLSALFACAASAQDDAKLTLREALRSARQNNGTVLAARLGYESAKASTKSAFSAFLPTVTPTYSREDGFIDTLTGPGRGRSDLDSGTSAVTASWLLFDNGERSTNYSRARTSEQQTEYQTLETYRSVLFSVHSVFYDALRSQQLLKVANSALERATTLQDYAEKRAEVGSGPRKDILQAKADALNAKVDVLTSTNQVSTSLATLKAVLGWPQAELPPLDDSESEQPTIVDYTLDQALAEGLANRPSLLASRKLVDLAKLNVRSAKLDTSVAFAGRANYLKSFSESQFDKPTFTLTASFPLFDGYLSRENLRAAELDLKARQASVVQDERDVRAEIESAYKEFRQNFDRREAAKLALDAARLNFESAKGSYTEGAGTILDQLTAQVSLSTAESNAIAAYYDLLISEVRLKLVTGRPLPGETDGE